MTDFSSPQKLYFVLMRAEQQKPLKTEKSGYNENATGLGHQVLQKIGYGSGVSNTALWHLDTAHSSTVLFLPSHHHSLTLAPEVSQLSNRMVHGSSLVNFFIAHALDPHFVLRLSRILAQARPHNALHVTSSSIVYAYIYRYLHVSVIIGTWPCMVS